LIHINFGNFISIGGFKNDFLTILNTRDEYLGK